MESSGKLPSDELWWSKIHQYLAKRGPYCVEIQTHLKAFHQEIKNVYVLHKNVEFSSPFHEKVQSLINC